MSSDFFVDRDGTWYCPIWNTSHGVHTWVLERIADLTEDAAVEEAVRERLDHPSSMFALSWFPSEQAAEMVRVIVGPLRDELRDETPYVRASVEELIAMAEGWAEATDVFPLFLPWKFVRQAGEPEVRYLSVEEPVREICFTGVRGSDLPDELHSPKISLSDGGYAIRAKVFAVEGFDGTVAATGLTVRGGPDRVLEHVVGS